MAGGQTGRPASLRALFPEVELACASSGVILSVAKAPCILLQKKANVRLLRFAQNDGLYLSATVKLLSPLAGAFLSVIPAENLLL
jgi:hypothetical protein